MATDERLPRISPDGLKLWVLNGTRVESIDLAGGHRETILELHAAGGAGMTNVTSISLADDPRAYAYSCVENSSRLFQIEGVK